MSIRIQVHKHNQTSYFVCPVRFCDWHILNKITYFGIHSKQICLRVKWFSSLMSFKLNKHLKNAPVAIFNSSVGSSGPNWIPIFSCSFFFYQDLFLYSIFRVLYSLICFWLETINEVGLKISKLSWLH